MKTLRYIVIGLIAALLAACGGNSGGAPAATTETTTASTAVSSAPLRVGATPVPHAEILRFIKDNLAQREGLQLEIIEFTDYVQPNLALNDGQIDANYFQHVPYMEEFGKQRGIDMVAVVPVHIEPLGIYSRTVQSLDAVPQGAVVAIPNDATNAGRALQLLAANGLITLREGVGTNATVRDITGNPKNLQITELEAAQLPRALEDTTLAVINGNYAIEAGLTPSKDALALESGQNNPYANVLVVLRGHENDPRVQALARLLQSPEVKQFIEDKYQGSVLPAF
ncbi:MetQ/NlpA family ABC transporter substrate-binding protein [Kallotenue papyrolyticum]|uniref:MetQ/NlpA family ABC transporter substrate-binding protein n=1 Tax=Kallotenue papyrolyticum TaxID=1325125 RepID=UPI0004786012|nr:MetQ/NlpA family ABC transporter substrate-binding protein [Kallotenue papyrolyticum]